MSKDIITTLATEALKDPNYSKTGSDEQKIEDKNFTEATNDISAVARLTLGAFLSQKTAKNAYPVSPTSTLVENKTRGTEAGLLVPPERNEQKVFANQDAMAPLQAAGLGIKNVITKGAANRQITFFGANDLKSLISKNASDPLLSGDTLLSEVPKETVSPVEKITAISAAAGGDGRGNALLKATHNQLIEGNMYTPDPDQSEKKPFSSNPGGQNEDEKTRGLFTIQKNLGVFDANGERVTPAQMKDYGEKLLPAVLEFIPPEDETSIVDSFKALVEMNITPMSTFFKLLPLGVRFDQSAEAVAALESAQEQLNGIADLTEASYAQIMEYISPIAETLKTKDYATGFTKLINYLLSYVDPPPEGSAPSYPSKILPTDYSDELDLNTFTEQNENDNTVISNGGKLGPLRRQMYRWGENRTSSMSLTTFFAAQRQLPVIAQTNPGNRSITPSRENVQQIEDALESEYMPFYIHDLRTHEIMSMPAFITEFGESFTPSYNSVEGIGRQDPVRLYQKTERAVTFGFMLVSFNENDHDHMWMTINKLVAMCYPQYSKGRIRETEKDADGNSVKFIQPFSQVPAASPLVRLRLADVFKSNYSKFGLMRLFGAGKYFQKTAWTEDVKDAQENLNTAKASAETSIKDDFKARKIAGDLKKGERVLLSENQKLKNAKGKAIAGAVQDGVIAELVEDGVTLYSLVYKEGKKTVQKKIPHYIVKIPSGTVLAYPAESVKSEMSEKDLREKVLKNDKVTDALQKLKDAKGGEESSSTVASDDFFSSENNAIVRSFETTRGRGVAGFITSLGLDYGMGSQPWSTAKGSRAPMIVKISLGFAPITDLPLGLDYDGDIRNPSHPVGNLAGGFGDAYYSLDSGDDANPQPKPMQKNIREIAEKTGWVDVVKEIKQVLEPNPTSDLIGVLKGDKTGG